MFIAIEPTKYHLHKDLIELFLERIKDNPILRGSFPNHENATFIISADETRSIYGGAMLLKQKVTSLHKKVQKNITNLGLMSEDIWTCTVFLHKENNNYSDKYEFFFETFYRDLYKKLAEFGLREKAGFLYMMLEPGEYFCTEVLGCWPYIFKAEPHESLKDISHRVLSLTVNPSKTHLKNGEAMFTAEIKLAA